MKKQVTSVSDIARMAGVSVATVSRVINQNGRFSKETEERVRKIIKECNYQPNILARGLRTNRVKIIGILVPDIVNEFFAKISLEIQNNLYAMGYSTIIFNTNEDAAVESRQISTLKNFKVSGLIFVSGNAHRKDLIDIPAIYIDRKPPLGNTAGNENMVFIESDNEQGGFIATEALIKKGCTKIACVSYVKEISSHGERLEGYFKALEKCELRYRRIVTAPYANTDVGYRITKKLLTKHPEVDGIFFTADLLAIGALKATNELGIAVPNRLRMVGFDDISLCGLSIPTITTVHQALDQFGLLAAKALVSMIDKLPLEKKYYKIPVHLVIRQSN
jgi:LacI family transcriptional regulator